MTTTNQHLQNHLAKIQPRRKHSVKTAHLNKTTNQNSRRARLYVAPQRALLSFRNPLLGTKSQGLGLGDDFLNKKEISCKNNIVFTMPANAGHTSNKLFNEDGEEIIDKTAKKNIGRITFV